MRSSSSLLKRFHPYFFIAIVGILAFAPVSFMLRALKNDIVAIEYPIKYFISECIRNGEIPIWFNTWAMGFPLQSSLSWGIYSTPQLFFSSLFNYNIYVLHLEFIFYVLLAGWSMFYLLKNHFSLDQGVAQILACCYMLSGFITGSSQWLLYITAASFAPLVLSSLLQLLKSPSFRNAFLFAVFYYLLFTNVYQAFNIISTYCIAGFLLYHILISWKDKKYLLKFFYYGGLSILLILAFCGPVLYYTLELLQYIERGNSIAEKAQFFNSNYLHPSGLSGLLMPLSVTKLSFPNTEGTMMNVYMGLFVLISLPLVIFNSIKENRKSVLILLFTSLLFILFSFGNILPFRNWMNILPGWSFFRHPGIFRFYFILFILLTIAIYFSGKKIEDILSLEKGKLLRLVFIFLTLIFLLFLISHLADISSFNFRSVEKMIGEISRPQTILINSLLQLLLLGSLFILIKKKKFSLFKFFFAADLIINALLCTPFFTVSSYSLPQVDKILSSVNGFPVQKEPLSEIQTTFRDEKNNTWYNINVFSKKVSSNPSYWGPLVLKNHGLTGNKLVLIENNDKQNQNSLQILEQKPSHLKIETNLSADKDIRIQQNHFPGWKAYYNNNLLPVIKSNQGFIVPVPAGEGMLEVKFEKKNVWISALIMHLIVLVTILAVLFQKFRKRRTNYD